MRFTLTLDLDNDAYQPDPREGIMATLNAVWQDLVQDWKATEGPILDPNGNTVGHWAIEDTTD